MMNKLSDKIKAAVQRAKRGYSDKDCQDFECWFFTIIPKMLDTYLSIPHAYPPIGKFKGIKSDDDWDDEIANLKKLFLESYSNTCSEVNEYEEQVANFIFENRILTENEKDIWDAYCKRSEEIDEYLTNNKKTALRLFTKYIHDLWT